MENRGLVVSLAKKFFPPTSTELDEYIAVANLGLLKAIRTHDETKASFTTWAVKNIQWEIIRYINNNKDKELPRCSIEPVYYTECAIDEYFPDSLEESEKEIILLWWAGFQLNEIIHIMDISLYKVSKILNSAIVKIRVANEE